MLTAAAVDCGQPASAVDADMTSPVSTTFNSSVLYRCFAGLWFYRDAFALTSTCQADGRWSQLERNACTRKKSFHAVNRSVFNLLKNAAVEVNGSLRRAQKG